MAAASAVILARAAILIDGGQCHAHGTNLSGQWRMPTIIWYLKIIKVPIFKSM
jgi:hypothetical protein